MNLFWQPGELDLSDRGDVGRFYSSALVAANRPEDFEHWIDRATLVELWDRLSLPERVRRAWETVHPQLRGRDTAMNDRIRIQDTVLAAIAEYGFALAGGSALVDYDVVARETDDIDAFNDRWDVTVFSAACARILDLCAENGWAASVVNDQDRDKQILVDAGSGQPVVVQLVFYGRSRDPEQRAGVGLRLVFGDVAAGKGAAVADVARGRDFSDLAHIIDTPGWSQERVEDAMREMRFGDLIDRFRANLERFRRGDFDDDIRRSGLDPQFCHRVLD